MATTVTPKKAPVEAQTPWSGFRLGLWQKEIDVRDFIQRNYELYEG